jgi:hydroxymethylglutaryl-CoA lyase
MLVRREAGAAARRRVCERVQRASGATLVTENTGRPRDGRGRRTVAVPAGRRGAATTLSREAASSFFGNVPRRVDICEVGPRDGLQNEPKDRIVKLEDKFRLITLLEDAGVKRIEAGSFVRAPRVPQMADSGQLMKMLVQRQAKLRAKKDARRGEGEAPAADERPVVYPVLVPNLKGLERAIEAGADEVALFVAASESFSQKNLGCSIEQSLEKAKAVTDLGRTLKPDLIFRGYVSTVLGCPYEGWVPYEKTIEVSHRLADLGTHEISLGDTIGSGTPGRVFELLEAIVASGMPVEKLAVHFHDTYGQALANTLMALQFGVATVDSSVAGLGGCPYAEGATGNLATEDLVFMLHGLGIETGIDLEKLIVAGRFISGRLGKEPKSRVSSATKAKGRLPETYTRKFER